MSGRHELDRAGIVEPALRTGYRQARAVNARYGRSYFLATSLLPGHQRPHVHALYGFARMADELVDTVPTGETDPLERIAAFDSWCQKVLTELRWGQSSTPLVRALINTLERYEIPLDYIADFLASMRADLLVTDYRTYDELVDYMWGSAAVIGLQMLPILGRADERVSWEVLEQHAIHLGLAFQLTNFLRDVAADLRRGRVYLPASSLTMFAVDRERLSRGRVDEPIRNLMAFEIERARSHYRAAAPGVELVAASSRRCLSTAFRLYAAILTEIESRDYDVFSSRATVGLWGRARASGPAVLGVARAIPTPRVSARSWRSRKQGLRSGRIPAAVR